MKKIPSDEAARWLAQAEDDLEFCRYALKGEFFSQVCFISQQVAEKALKSLCYKEGARNVLGHSVAALINQLSSRHFSLSKFVEHAAELDLYYIPTRYPNGLVEGTARSAFTSGQSKRALASAEAILDEVRRLLNSFGS